MRTFSEIVDACVSAVGQPDLLHYIASAANAIILDLQTNHPSAYDLAEHRWSVGISGKYVVPIPPHFRAMRAVRFDGRIFVENAQPGLKQKSLRLYWYQSGSDLVFIGARHVIDVSYYTSRRVLKYVFLKNRKIRSSAAAEHDYDYRKNVGEDTDWQPFNIADAYQKRSFYAHVNRIIYDYPEAIMFGVLSKTYNHLGQLDRGARAFQDYAQQKDIIRRQQGLHNTGEL